MTVQGKLSHQVAKSVTSPLLDSEIGVVFWGFRPVLGILAKHSRPGGPIRAANLRVVKWAVTS